MNRNDMPKNSIELPVKLGGMPAVTQPQPHFRWPLPDPEAEEAVIQLMRNSELSYFRLDGQVQIFEEAYKKQMGLNYAVTTHSGTGAIHAGWFGMDIAPGSEVIVPAYTHIGTAMPLFHLGLIPVLCDVDPKTGNIDPAAIPSLITKRSAAIGVTHQFGLSADMDAIVHLAREHNLQILEDCSHAHGAYYKGRPVGSMGDVACFSLQSHKTVSVGEGGILLTSNLKIAERASLLGHFRQQREFSSKEQVSLVETGYGMKSRLHPLAAAIGVVALKKMPAIIKARNQHYKLLSILVDQIPGLNVLPTPEDFDRGGYFKFVLQVDSNKFAGMTAAQIAAAVQDEGAKAVTPGALARCLQSFRIFQDASISPYKSEWTQGENPLEGRPVFNLGDFFNAERFSTTTIQMPAFTEPSADLIAQYASAFAKVQKYSSELKGLY